MPLAPATVLDAAGRPMRRAAMMGGLEAGGYGRRLASFVPSRQHVNALIAASGATVNARARYLARNSTYARNGADVWASASVGSGIKPSLQIDNDVIKERLHALWARWVRQSDAEGVTDFYGQMRRAARAEFIIEAFQDSVLIQQVCQPVWERFVTTAYLSGIVELPGFANDPSRYFNVKWMPPKWDWVDPWKDWNAEKLAVRSGFKSRREVVASMGYDIEELDREIARDNDRNDGAGLVFDSDARRTAQSGVMQEPPVDHPPQDQPQQNGQRP